MYIFILFTWRFQKVNPGEETYDEEGAKFYKLKTDPNYKHRYVPAKVIIFTLLHAGALYGLYLILTFQIKLQSFIWGKTRTKIIY